MEMMLKSRGVTNVNQEDIRAYRPPLKDKETILKTYKKDDNEHYNVDQGNELYSMSDAIIIAWGSAGHNSQRVRDRQVVLLDLLKTYPLKIITDGGETAFHPLSPAVRDKWILKDYREVYDEENSDNAGDE